MKLKKSRRLILLLIFVLGSVLVFNYISRKIFLNQLKGTYYYVSHKLNLYKCDANLKNRKKIYDGVIKFNYNIEKNIIYYWHDSSIYSLKPGEKERRFVKDYDSLDIDFNLYLKQPLKKVRNDGAKIINKNGSIYLVKNNQERCLKKFNGKYIKNRTGYFPLSLSPDEKYLTYRFIRSQKNIDAVRFVWVMNLETGKSIKLIRTLCFQWIDE